MKRKKIGVLTFHRAINYGAVLQAYALVKVLQKKGYDSEVVDYRNHEMEQEYYYTWIRPDKNIKRMIRSVLAYPIQVRRNRAFAEVFRNNYDISSKTYTRANIVKAAEEYDKFIVGSDQVWNIPCISDDPTYFLDFVSDTEKKGSYAASLGKLDLANEQYEKYYPLLRRFKNLSVREQQGKEFLEQHIHRDVEVDVDPTFLLNDSEWRQFETKPELNEYVLLYSVNLAPSVLEYARMIAKEKRIKLIIVSLCNKKIALQAHEKDFSDCSPSEFVGLIDYANLVITNSFHGTAYSIIMQTDFLVIRNSAAKQGLDNSRLDNLLKLAGLEYRVGGEDGCMKAIDFDDVTRRISQERDRSLMRLEYYVSKT